VSGGTPSRKKPDYFTGSIPWLTGYDLPEDQVAFIDEAREYVTEAAIKKSATNLVPPQTVLLTTRVTVGKVAIAQKQMCFSQDVTGIIIDNAEIIEPAYLAHFLLATREAFLFRNRGTTIQGITRGDLERFQIPLPPLSEQRRIVDILRQADDLRRLRREADAQMEDLQTALFNDILGDPILNPKGWLQLPIETVCEIKAGPFGSSLKKEIYTDSGYRVYGQEQVIAGDFTVGDYYISEQKFREMAVYEVKPDDVLISLVGTLGEVVVVPDGIEPGIINPRLLKITPDTQRVTADFLTHLLKHPSTQRKLEHFAYGGTMNILSTKVLRNLIVSLPPIGLQVEFARRIEQIQKLKDIQESTRSRYDDLSNSFLARAFTGELTDTWRDQHTEQMQEEAAQRDIALGLRPRKSDIEFTAELDTQAGREAFDHQVQEALRPTAEQLLGVAPEARLDDIVEIEPLLDLNRLVSPVLSTYRNTVNASLLRGIEQLSRATQESLANSVRSMQALAQRALEAHQRQIVELAGQLAQMAALVTRRPDEDHPRFHSLRTLSDEQYWVYLATLRSDGYFTAENLLDEDELPVENVRRTLALLETSGLVARVTVPAAPTGTAWFYVPAYRALTPDDDSRDDDLAVLEAAFPGLAA